MHHVINFLVNNRCTLSIWSMRLRNLLTFEKVTKLCMHILKLVCNKYYMHLIIL